MKILLARANNENVYALYKPIETDRIMPPLPLMYLESFLDNAGHEVKIWDGFIDKKSFQETLDEFKPGIVGAGGTTPDSNYSCELFKETKEYSKDILTVAGGPHFQMFTPDDYENIDYIVKGDGEIALCYLADGNIPENKVVEMAPTEELYNTPPIMWDRIKDWPYNFAFEGRLEPTATMLTSRGCPYKCIFCQNSKNYRKVRFRSIPNVIADVEAVVKKGIKHIYFADETFSLDRDRTIELCRAIKEYNIKWKCLTRADCIDYELVSEMVKAGCVGISNGIESGNEQILKNTKKGVSKEQIVKSYEILNQFEGLEKRASFIIGHPYETEENVNETINFALSLPIDIAFFNIMTPYPSCIVYDMALKGEGIWLVNSDWNSFRRAGDCAIRTEELSPEDLIRLQKKAQMRFFTQPRVIISHLRWLMDTGDKVFCNRPIVEALEWKDTYIRKKEKKT